MLEKLSNTQKVLILLGFLIVGGLVGYFWHNISSLWSDKTPVLDENGKPTGKYVRSYTINGTNRAMRNCCSWGGGFIGKDCDYPITKKDTVSPCALL